VIEVRAAIPDHYTWIATRANVVIGANFRALEAVDGERIVGMVGYDGWTPNSCCMHVAVETPIAVRRLLRPAFHLVFDDPPRGCGKGVVLGSVLSTNKKAMDLDIHLGFKPIAFVKDGWAKGVGIHILEMRKENCRWIGDK
jgi:hypothetical protein